LYQWIREIRHRFSHLGKWQAVGLAVFSYGVVQAEHSHLSKIAERLPQWGSPIAVERRLQRWLSNPRLWLELCFQAWVKWLLASFDGEQWVLLVDETHLGEHLSVMMVGLAYQTRCIPLYWRCYLARAYPAEGQVKLIGEMLARLASWIPAEHRPLLQADRGIGTSPDLIRAVEALGWRYLFRVQNATRLVTRRGQTRALHTLVRPGESWRGYGLVFPKRGRIRAHVRVLWRGAQTEPWCLVTNDPLVLGGGYAMRGWQEESFRDLKSGGWQWQRSQVWLPAHAERLILILALAYAWALTQGTLLFTGQDAWRRRVSRGSKRRYSLFREGLRHLRQAVCFPERVYPGLFFAPDKLLC
jgi:hypothetical protein